MRNKAAKGKKTWFWVAIYLVLLVVVGAIIYVVPSLAGLFDRSYIAEYGEIEVTDDTEGLVVRDEIVYTAASDSTVKHSVEEGELVKGYTQAVSLSAAEISEEDKESEASPYQDLLDKLGDSAVSTLDGVALQPGYISYQLDGLEYLNEETLAKLKKKQFQALSSGDPEALDETAAAGEPVFKLVRNGIWYYAFYLDNDEAEKYSEDASVTVTVGEESFTATVAALKKGEQQTRITLTSEAYYEGFLTDRQIEAQVTTAKATGVLLESDSIIEKDGQLGVITKNKVGKQQFKPVSVKADNGEQAAVYEDYYMDSEGNFVETVNPYDEVVRSPSKEDIKEAKDING